MPHRTWVEEAGNEIPAGWEPDGAPIEVSAQNEQDVFNTLLEAAAVLKRVGGTLAVLAVRKEIAPGLWVPDRYVFKWESFAPGIPLPQQREQEPEPLAHEADAELEPEPAETP